MHAVDSMFYDKLSTAPLRAVRAALAGLPEAEYFEFRLRASSQVDYLTAIPQRRAALARNVALDICRRGSLSHRAVWCRLACLFEAWADGASLVSMQSPAMWLEFDHLCSPTPQVRPPSVSVCLVPGYRTDEPLSAGDSQRARDLVADVLLLLDVEEAPALARRVADCFEALPAGARWIHLSVMLGRAPCAVKLYGSVQRNSLLPVLQHIGWRGDLRVITGALDQIYARDFVGDELLIDLNLENVGDPERASLGLALGRQHSARGPLEERTHARALQTWVDCELATHARASIAAQWACEAPGHTGFFTDLKLVWQSGVGFDAKAYLGRHPVSGQQLAGLTEQRRFLRLLADPLDHG